VAIGGEVLVHAGARELGCGGAYAGDRRRRLGARRPAACVRRAPAVGVAAAGAASAAALCFPDTTAELEERAPPMPLTSLAIRPPRRPLACMRFRDGERGARVDPARDLARSSMISSAGIECHSQSQY